MSHSTDSDNEDEKTDMVKCFKYTKRELQRIRSEMKKLEMPEELM